MKRKYSVHSCPVGYSLGHDGDECRVTTYQDGTAFCRTCNTLYPGITGHNQVRTTLSALARVASSHGCTKPPFIEKAHNYPNIISFCQQLDNSGHSFAILTIDESHFNLPEHSNPTPIHQQFIADLAPESVVSAIRALEELGFLLHHRTNTQDFLMRLGDADGGLNITVRYL